MKYSILGKLRFSIIAAVCVLAFLAISSISRDAGAQSFSIDQAKVYGPVIPQYNQIIGITNLAGKTQTLTVTVVNPNSTLQFEMLNNKSEVVPLGSSIVLFKDSTGWDHGTFLFAHPSVSATKFTTLVIFTDASNTTSDTLVFNVNDTVPPSPIDMISVSPQGPITIPFGHNGAMSVDLTVTNLTTNYLGVAADEQWGSAHFSPSKDYFSLTGNPGSNTHVFTVTYDGTGRVFPDSALYVFTPDAANGASVSVEVVVIDTTAPPPTLTIIGKNFFNVLPGSQHCDNLIIENTNNLPITITDLSITGTGAGDFALTTAPSLPLTIDKFSKIVVPFCYNAPNTRGTYSTPQLAVTFHTQGGADLSSTDILYGLTAACLVVTPDSVHLGSIIAGGNTQTSVTINNPFDQAITLTKESWLYLSNGQVFSLTGATLPVQIAAKGSTTLTFTFAPPTTTFGGCYGAYSLDFTGSGDSKCTTMQIGFDGVSIDPSDTSRTEYELFPNVASAMPISSDQQTTSKDFIFYNNTSNAVKVVSVSVKDGTHFAVAAPTSADLPITLQPNDQMKVTISFDANTNGFYSDELDIVTQNGLTSQAFSLQGVRKNGTSAGVASTKAVEPQIMLSPNPSHGPVAIAISDADIRSIDIYDMLGNLVASEKNMNLWVWDGKMMDGNTASDGTYFIRVSGVTTSGAPFVKTTKLLRR